MALDDEWEEETDHPAHPANQPERATSSDDWVADQDWQEDTPGKKPMGWGEYLGRGATGVLPYAGALGGGVVGSGTAPLAGTIGGGTLGYMGGKEAEKLLNHYLFGDENNDKSATDMAKRVGGNAMEGVEQELMGMNTAKVMEATAPWFKNMAEKYAVRHLRPTPQVARTLGPDRLKDIGREALDSGAIRFGGKADGTAARLADRMDESGSLIDDLVGSSTKETNPVDIANRFESEIIDPLRKTSGNEALIKKLEEQKSSFLERYAPGHEPGGRDPSLPTTITRKTQFIPAKPKTNFEDGLAQIGEKRTPRVQTEVVERQVPGKGPGGITPGTEKELRVFHDGEDVEPVMGYHTPEPSEPFVTDPKTGLPVKRTVEKRIEANPAPKKMSARDIEAQKRVEDDRVNWLTDPKLNSKAQMGWAGVLRDEGEKAVDNPAFPAAKRAYGNQALAKSMADRTNALTDGGTGLFGHMTDLGVNLEALHQLANGNPAGIAMSAARAGSKGRYASSMAKSLDSAAKALNNDTAKRMGGLVSRPVWHTIRDREKQPRK